MNVKVDIDIDINTARIIKSRGLDGPVQKFIASEVARLCDKYVPMQQGMLKNQHTIASDGSSITYTQPYAHYQYYGQVMAGRAPKRYTGDSLHYSGAMRGDHWDKRMMADKSHELTKSVADFVGGK